MYTAQSHTSQLGHHIHDGHHSTHIPYTIITPVTAGTGLLSPVTLVTMYHYIHQRCSIWAVGGLQAYRAGPLTSVLELD